MSAHAVRPVPQPRAPIALGIGLTLTAAASALAWPLTGAPAAAAVALAGLAFVAVLVRVGARAFLLALALLIVPPGLAGENSAEAAAVAVVCALLLLVTAERPAAPAAHRDVALLAAGLAAVGGLFVVSSGLGQLPAQIAVALGAIYAGAAVVLVEGARRPALFAASLRAVAYLVCFEILSYCVTALAGFTELSRIDGPHRDVTMWWPVTLTIGEAGSLFDQPRLTVFSGEPGLSSVLILVSLWTALTLERGRMRVGLVVILALGSLLTQSTGLIFALIAFAAGSAVYWAKLRFGLTAAIVLAAIAAPALVWVTQSLLDAKAASESGSIADRGLLGGEAVGQITLLAAAAKGWPVAAALIAGLAALAVIARSRALDVGLVAALGLTALFAQPLQYHPAAWLLLTACVCVVSPAAARQTR